jgi:hypothetical protein
VLLLASSAFTVTLTGVPAVAVEGAVTDKCVAGGVTETALEVPVMDAFAVSLAVTVRLPAVLKVTENVPTPLVSFEFAGRTAALSVLVNFTVPV